MCRRAFLLLPLGLLELLRLLALDRLGRSTLLGLLLLALGLLELLRLHGLRCGALLHFLLLPLQILELLGLLRLLALDGLHRGTLLDFLLLALRLLKLLLRLLHLLRLLELLLLPAWNAGGGSMVAGRPYAPCGRSPRSGIGAPIPTGTLTRRSGGTRMTSLLRWDRGRRDRWARS